MKKRILMMYGIAAIVFGVLILYGLMNFRASGQNFNTKTGYETLINFSVAEVADETLPIEKKTLVTLTLEKIRGNYNTLVFYTFHQNVRVYLGSECIYSMEALPGFMMPSSPGRVLHQIELGEEFSGKQLQIELIPIYSGMVDTVPDFLLGSRYDILSYVMSSNRMTLLLCILSIMIGLVMIVFQRMDKEKENRQSVTESLGKFSIVVGLWKAFDCSVFGLVTVRLPGFSVMPFFVLMLLPGMLTAFIRGVTGEKQSLVWDIPDLLTVLNVVLILFLQLTKVSDLWQNLWLVQGCLIVSGVCIAIGLFQIVRQYGWKQNVKRGVICACCCLIWVFVDTITYYAPQGIESVPLSILVYLIFLIMIAVNHLRESKTRMEEGMQARQYSKLAFHDALTGFYNKAAYMEHLSGGDISPQKSVMVAFDLNDLKKCNDQFGHDKGDLYVKECAKIIMDCFGEKGRCYRLGGDEFGAILSGATLEDCEKCAERMRERVQRFNDASRDIHMGIACGYAIFDPKEDEDINATIRRADKMMYEVKFKMKQMKI